MSAPTNLGFETSGGRAGLAASWSVYTKQLGYEIAGYAGTNLLNPIVEPIDLEDPSWTPYNVILSNNEPGAPNGSATANLFYDDATNDIHAIIIASGPFVADTAYTLGCYFKADSLDCAALVIAGDIPLAYAIFDVANGRTLAFGNTSPLGPVSAVVVDVGNGWFRASISFSPTSDLASAYVSIATSDGSNVIYAGSGDKLLAWGAFFYEGVLEEHERFERGWLENEVISPAIDAPEFAIYETDFVDPAPVETFETGWNNYPLVDEISLAEAAVFDSTPEAVEDFEEGWLTNESVTQTIVSSSLAEYNSTLDGTEEFEMEWLSNENITQTITSSTSASYDGPNAEAVEDFEEVLLDREIVDIDTSTDILTITAHGFVGTNVVYPLNVGGVYPGGLYKTTPYWVLVIDVDHIKLSKTQAGAAVDITSAGEPSRYLRGDPSRYWNSGDYNSTLG